MSLLIVDTEGIGAFDEDQNHDTRVFMLSVLVSSYFIYNSVGCIDENALNNLNLVVNLTKNLQVRASDTQLDVDEVAEYFPSFLWLLRDFALQLRDPAGNPINSREYLEQSLQPQKGVSDSVEAKNRIRKLIKHFFRERDCFTMVRPSEDELVLQSLDSAADWQVRPEFLRQIEQLRKLIYRKVKPKYFNGEPMTGEMLKVMVLSYVDSINNGSVPTIEGAWKSVCQAETEKNIENTTLNYEANIKAATPQQPVAPKELKRAHKEYKAQALKSFRANAVGEVTPEIEAALEKALDEKFATIV